MKRRLFLSVMLSLVLCMAGLAGCSKPEENEGVGNQLTKGGVICLRVNPEIAVLYDENGMVTKVEARNDDGEEILKSFKEFEGKECRTVISELVKAIGNAGYFVEEVEGEGRRQITIEIEEGSKLPSETFLDDIIVSVRDCVSQNQWKSPIVVEGESDYGMTDYIDTDYGVGNDGATDYDDTDYGPNNDGVTDYDDTDYGPNNDGVTDYDDTDYGSNNDGVTDYDSDSNYDSDSGYDD